MKRLDSEQPDNSESFPVVNLLFYFMNSEQPGDSEQFWDDQKVSYHQVQLHHHLLLVNQTDFTSLFIQSLV